MFTGIIIELGEVVAVERLAEAARITVTGPTVTAGAARGDSIAVNGACLTVTDISPPAFTADVMVETLARTTLGALAPGSRVNLELPLRLSDRLGGHLVQGHVDGVATLISRDAAVPGRSAPQGPGLRTPWPATPGGAAAKRQPPATPRGPAGRWDVLRFAVPGGLSRYVVQKGSVAVDGTSLTVSATGCGDRGPAWFEVSLIPATLATTTLGLVRPGDGVNLEVDLIGKYVERLLMQGREVTGRGAGGDHGEAGDPPAAAPREAVRS